MNKLLQFNHLEWDSSFFGLDVFQFACSGLSSNGIRSFLRTISCKNKLLVYFQSRDFLFRQHSSYRSGLRITYEGVQMTYAMDLSGTTHSSSLSAPLLGRYLPESNFQQLFDLSVEAGQFSRFKKDLAIPYSDFLKLYNQWTKKSVAGIMADEIFVRYFKGRIVGFASVKRTSAVGAQISLIAVNPSDRGLGVGKDLVKAVQHWCSCHSIRRLLVSTQGDNLLARSFYTNCGFSVSDVSYMSHLRWTSKTHKISDY